MSFSLKSFSLILTNHCFDFVAPDPGEESYKGFDFSSIEEAKDFAKQLENFSEASVSVSDASYPDENENPDDCWVVVTLSITYESVKNLSLDSINEFLSEL